MNSECFRDLSLSVVAEQLRQLPLDSGDGVSFRKGVVEVLAKSKRGPMVCWQFTTSPVEDMYGKFWKDIVSGLAVVPQLVREIKAKDEEIQDYIANGAKVSRKSLKTARFDVAATCKKAASVAAPVNLVASSEDCRMLIQGMSRAIEDKSREVIKEETPPPTTEATNRAKRQSPQKPKNSITSKISKPNPKLNRNNNSPAKSEHGFM